MGFITWLGENWGSLAQTGALLLVASVFFLDLRVRRVANLIRLTEQHRELWEKVHGRPRLARILDPAVNLDRKPVTAEEELFVISLILHLSTTYYASKTALFWKSPGLEKDVRQFFSRPIPRAVWEHFKDLQDEAFARFVDACLPPEQQAGENGRDKARRGMA